MSVCSVVHGKNINAKIPLYYHKSALLIDC